MSQAAGLLSLQGHFLMSVTPVELLDLGMNQEGVA